MKLTGTDFWRLRIGDLRIIYSIDHGADLVVVLRCRPALREHIPPGPTRPAPGSASTPIHHVTHSIAASDASAHGTTATSTVKVQLIGADGLTLEHQMTTSRQPGRRASITSTATWPSRPRTVRAAARGHGATGDFGETDTILNALGATVGLRRPHARNRATVTGTIFELYAAGPRGRPADLDPATFTFLAVALITTSYIIGPITSTGSPRPPSRAAPPRA